MRKDKEIPSDHCLKMKIAKFFFSLAVKGKREQKYMIKFERRDQPQTQDNLIIS